MAALEKQGALRRISEPIDKDRELHPLVRWQYRGIDEPERAGFLFENVVDRQGRRFRGQVATSVVAPNRDIYALAMGCRVDEVHARWTDAMTHFVAPKKPRSRRSRRRFTKGPRSWRTRV